MPKHYESDKDPKIPPRTSNKYKKSDVFETKEKKQSSKKTKRKSMSKRKY